jgi:hypothetical protein
LSSFACKEQRKDPKTTLPTIPHPPSPDTVTDQKAEIQRLQMLLDEAV